jgi:hypothetical protein
MLTNMLPHIPRGHAAGGGQGPVTLFAYATDLEGQRALLGERTITLDNDHATRPFGAIDTPAQGGTVSGVIPNFGWALTPGTAMIPTNGSTMQVVIDGIAVGNVTYNQCRAGSTNLPPVGSCRDDVATLFPGFTNIIGGSGAIGSFDLDTRTLSDGLHTIAWGVIDDQGRNDGIGSRFFRVSNGSSSLVADTALRAVAPDAARLPDSSVVSGRAGFDFDAPMIALTPDDAGVHHVRIPELGRLELALGADTSAGYLIANGERRPLPAGSNFDATTGRFTWSAGAGYLGAYDFVFLRPDAPVRVAVTVRPATLVASGSMRASLDRPSPGDIVSGSFVIAGWALDTDAWHGAGVGAVHVWAQRRDVPAADPVFLGAADRDGVRPDVAAAFGAQFEQSGWGMSADLPPGLYDLTAYFWSTRTGRFEDARTVTITVR